MTRAALKADAIETAKLNVIELPAEIEAAAVKYGADSRAVKFLTKTLARATEYVAAH